MKTFFLISLLFLIAGNAWSAGGGKNPLYGEILCASGDYDCREVRAGETWETIWPDERERDLVRRLNRMNVKLKPGMILAVPFRLRRAKMSDIAPLPKKMKDVFDDGGEKTILVDLSVLAWAAYDGDGRRVSWGPASGGKGWCPDVRSKCRTRVGDFLLVSKGGAKCKSHKFPIPRGGAPMPWCLFFKSGYALHGSPEVPGRNASHGCVRLFTEDAEWLNQSFADEETRIVILPYEDPALIQP